MSSTSSPKSNLLAALLIIFTILLTFGAGFGSILLGAEWIGLLIVAAVSLIILIIWPSSPILVLYPLIWPFSNIYLPVIDGRPERLIGVAGLLGLLIAMQKARITFPKLPRSVTIGLLLLVGSYIAAWAFHPDSPSAINFSISLVARLVFFYLVYAHIRTRRQLKLAVMLFISGGFIASLLVLGISYQYGFGYIRVYENYIAAQQGVSTYLLIGAAAGSFNMAPAIMLLGFYPTAKSSRKQFFILAGTFFLLWIAFLAEFRREILISIPVIMLFFVLYKKSRVKSQAALLLFASVFVFSIILLPKSIVLQDRLRYETVEILQGTELRIQTFSAGLRAFGESPFIGYGPGSFEQSVVKYLGIGRPSYEYHAYNTFIWVAVEAGILGLLAVILILYGTYRKARNAVIGKDGEIETMILQLGPILLLQIIIWFTFGNSWEASTPWFLMGAILAAERIAKNESAVS